MVALVRKGLPADISAALELVKELAEFELAPLEVEVTLEQMLDWGFGKNKLFDFYVVESQEKIVGLALYYFKYSTWKGRCLFLEDIIVTKSERRKGYGALLFNTIVQVAKQEGVKRMEWQVLNWNIEAIHFYKKYACSFDKEWVNCKFTNHDLQSM